MGTSRSANTDSKMRRTLNARKWARGKASVLCVLGVVVTLSVAGLLMQNVMAAKTKVRVLDCPVTEAVAHHHNADCYDEHGELVCPLPERELHTHSKECYERQLVCEMEEGEGAHLHDKSCYDEEGNLVCKLKEGKGHKHTDDCYADILVCGKEEVTEEHVHGDGCFHTIAVGDDADQTIQPEQFFTRDVTDDNDNYKMRIEVASPEGALPEGTTMEATLVDADSVDRDAMQAAIDDKAAKLETLEPGKLLDFQAVDITFRDSEGNSIEPKEAVTVLLSSELVTSDDATVVLHLDDKADPTAEVIDTLSEKQVIKQGFSQGSDQIAFQSSRFSTYVLATTSLHRELQVTDDETVTITLDAPAEAGIPASAGLEVSEIARDADDYDSYVDSTAEATKLDKDDIGLARFFDITIKDGDEEVHPQAPVDVKIELSDIPSDPTDFKLVHYAEDADGKQAEAPEEVAAGGEDGTTTFSAESFSVYGIVYTVDFGYQVGDKVYEFDIKGGGAVSMTELIDQLHIYEDAAKKYNTAEKLAAGITNVEFSNTDLVRVEHIDERMSVSDIRAARDISVQYSDDLSEEQRSEIEAREYENEWVLFSLKPFLSTEMLTITMADESQLFIKVTDGWYTPPYKRVGNVDVVTTIANPGATSIDLFDYWVSDERQQNGSTFKAQWPGWRDNHNYDRDSVTHTLSGEGNWIGINAGDSHSLKFTPANDGTVFDANRQRNQDGHGGINDYTGNADPVQGIVQSTLDDYGYPKLSGQKGGGTESLMYLFDDTASTEQGSGFRAGKRVYKDVNQLLYIDTETGYYTYDSRYVDATYNASTNTFSEKMHNQHEADNARNGFWPFGYGNWWFGMHVNTQFIMPTGGQVFNTRTNQNEDMTFMFSGDDDAWVYIDGVLIGDGGGIHNRTEIDINFADGSVLVTGKKDDNHGGGTLEQTTSLRALFLATKGQQWVDEHFNGNVFKENSVHVFDFFYLERGGGESNLYLSYNLVSTTDFQAKKQYITEDGRALTEDKFNFYLLGMDGRINATGDNYISGKGSEPAIMPAAPDSGKGTASDPSLTHTMYPIKNDDGTYTLLNASVYKTGNQATGDVVFGTAQIPENLKRDLDNYLDWMDEHAGATIQDAEAAGFSVPKYRYIVMEYVPPHATNAEGVTWENATVQQMIKGGFYDGSILYDGQIYYMECTLAKRQSEYQGTPAVDSQGRPVYEYVLERRFYDDVRYNWDEEGNPRGPIDADPNTPGVQNPELLFTNTYIEPVWIDVVKANSKNHTPLEGAKFELGFAVEDKQAQRWAWANTISSTIETGPDGKVNLSTPLHPGNYLLQEKEAPAGYKLSNYMWLIEMVSTAELDPNDPVEGPYYDADSPRIIPFLTRLNLDGTPLAGAAGQRMNLHDMLNGHSLEGEFPNEPVEEYKLTVEKQWEQIGGDDSALEDSTIAVSLGRYALTDRYATLSIVKQGIPQGADVTAVYVVYRVNNGNEERFATFAKTGDFWTGSQQGDTVATLNLPVEDGIPTQYKVYEMIFYDDNTYTHVHNAGISNPQEVILEEGDNESVTFTATYERDYGDIYITTSFKDSRVDQTTPIDKSGVYYVLYDNNYNVIKVMNYADVTNPNDPNYVAGKGYHVGRYEAGRYIVREGGWPFRSFWDSYFNGEFGYYGGEVGVVLTKDAQYTANFDVEYKDTPESTIYVVVYDKNDPRTTAVEVAHESFTRGVIPTVKFTAKPGSSNYYDNDRSNDCVIAGERYLTSDYEISWTDGRPDGTQDPDTPLNAQIRDVMLYFNSMDPSQNYTYVYIGVDGTEVTMSDITDVSFGAMYIPPSPPPPPTIDEGGSGIPDGPVIPVDPDPVPFTPVEPDPIPIDLDDDGTNGSEGSDGRSLSDTLNGTSGNASLPAEAILRAQLENAANAAGEDEGEHEVVSTGDTINLIGDDVLDVLQLTADDGTSGATRGGTRNATNGIKPGNLTLGLYWNATDGPGAPPTDTSKKKYVPDTPFNDDQINNPIILTQDDCNSAGVWAQTVKNFPAYDADGNMYYYYIQQVVERKMPEGTTGQILTDPNDATKQRLSHFIEPDPQTPDVVPDPQHLAVSNRVANPADIKLYKVDANDTTVLLEGAKFHLQKKDEHGQFQTVLEPEVAALGSGETVDLDTTTGIFEVPKHGMEIKGLLIGEYKLVEDECPPGYVMNVTEYTFKVNQGGELEDIDSNFVYDDSVDEFALFVPNPPGSELPHAGGVGETLFTLFGAALMVVGATMLLKRRREA